MFRHIFGSSIDREGLARGTVDAFWKAHARAEPVEIAEKRRRNEE
jgi:hypothetical protein